MKQDLFSLEGRVALVTGGNGGLGRAMTLGMKHAGAQVVVTGRNPEKNKEIGEELADPKSVLSLDVRDEEAVERAMSEVVTRFGRLDILINNAGGWKGGSILNLTREDWDSVVSTHLTGSFLCAKHAAKAMMSQETGGKIINIGSMFSVFGVQGGANYSAAKTGILGLTRSLAIELADLNIQVNAILPGWHWTPLTQPMKDTAIAEKIRRKTPARRWGTADDIVGAAIFLASSASDFVTGTSIAVDGGYSITDQFRDEE
jgi:2-dehydro-3-deoxy-D-gluconate 5-dehydrogenase